jgi:predicted methyltransferase
MAKATTMSNAAVKAEADALVALLANGYLRIYSGAQPANADEAIVAQVLLAELRFANPAAGQTPDTGIITFDAITSDSDANATGNAAWFRALKSDGVTGVMDGTVDVAGNSPNLALATVAIQQHAVVAVTSFTHTINKTTAGL